MLCVLGQRMVCEPMGSLHFGQGALRCTKPRPQLGQGREIVAIAVLQRGQRASTAVVTGSGRGTIFVGTGAIVANLACS